MPKIKKKKDKGDLVYDQFKQEQKIKKLGNAALAARDEKQRQAIEETRRNIEALNNIMSSMCETVYSPLGMPVRANVEEELFSAKASFQQAYSKLTDKYMPPEVMFTEAERLVARVRNYAELVIDPEADGDIEMLEPFWPMLKTITKNVGWLNKLCWAAGKSGPAETNNSPERILASSIIEARRCRGLTQHDVAKMVGILQPSLARIERLSHGIPKIATLKKIAGALNARLVVRIEIEGKEA